MLEKMICRLLLVSYLRALLFIALQLTLALSEVRSKQALTVGGDLEEAL